MTQFSTRNISMMMDLYEMTMANGYFAHHETQPRVIFDIFYRKNPDEGGFAIFAGLEQMIEYVENMHFTEEDIAYFESLNLFSGEFLAYLKDFHFSGDIYAFPEGTVMYPNEPCVTVVAPLIDAQLVETALLALVNHQSLIATKTSRIVRAADGRAVSDFGARRAHNMDAAVYGARAAYIAGAVGTATVLAGQKFNIPVSGTMAHSWVMFYQDEYTITSILRQGGQIDAFGVGERLITAKSDPVFGAVYKIAAVEYEGRYVPRIKVSEAVEKITNPGFKRVYRIYGEEGYAVADLIAGFDEVVDMSKPYRYVDPEKPWKNRFFENCTVKELQQLVVKDGKRVQPKRDLEEIRAYVKQQLDKEIWQEEQRFENPHKHYLDMSPDYYEMKMSLLHDLRG